MKISFGNKKNVSTRRTEGALSVDLEKENVHFILLIGENGAGKSFFHRRAYHDLIEGRLPHDIGFVFLDIGEADSREWQHSTFLAKPLATTPAECLAQWEKLAEEEGQRTVLLPTAQSLIVHIEEDTLARTHPAHFEKALEKILKHKKTNSIYIFYFASSIEQNRLARWLKEWVDLLVVFKLHDEKLSRFLTGDTLPLSFAAPGEHLVLYQGQKIRCAPFSDNTQIL